MKEKEQKGPNSKPAYGSAALMRLGLLALYSIIATYGVRACNADANSKAAEALRQEATLLQEKGLLGERPIVDLREIPNFNFNGQIAGGFLFTTGTFHGETTQMMEFAWKPNDKDTQISSVPVRNVRFLIFDDPNTKPTVQFTGIKPKELLNDPVNESENVNDFVGKAADELTLITLSQKDYDGLRGTQAK